MTIRIWQVRRELLREFGFLSYESAIHFNGKDSVRISNYALMYEFDVESSCDLTLDDIYEIFNQRRPDDFKGHSLSVSDVIQVDSEFWYCDDIGWKKLDWSAE